MLCYVNAPFSVFNKFLFCIILALGERFVCLYNFELSKTLDPIKFFLLIQLHKATKPCPCFCVFLLFPFKSLRGLNFIAQFHTSLWVILLVATIKGCAINFRAHIHKNPRKPNSRCHLFPWVFKPNDWWLSCQACRWQVCQVSWTSGWLPGPNHHQPG